MRSSTAAALSTVLLFLAATPAHAGEVRELAHDLRIDVAVTSVGSVWWITSELLKADLIPEKCRWCYRAADGTDLLNPFDKWSRDHMMWKSKNTADVTSSALAFVVEPVLMLGLMATAAAADDATKGIPLDALLVTEATVVAGNVNQLVKFAFARERPFVHFLPRAPTVVRNLTDSPSDDNLSFFSGHTTLAFSIATASGTLASMRGYHLAPLVWATGLPMAGLIGYLRVAADKHYMSDVLTAAVVGSVIGVGVPLLFHSPRETRDPAPVSSAQALTGPPVRTAFSMSGAF